jgi:5-methylcytosine-specific restriction endonuclease McrA
MRRRDKQEQPAFRVLPPIPLDPRPTKRQTEAELRKRAELMKKLPPQRRRQVAEFFWAADQRAKTPDLFWHPFAPDPMRYEAYLISKEWQQISRAVKKAAGGKCACCPSKATNVHHRCYRPRVLSGADTSLLIALCRPCHETVDSDERGKPREAHEKERVLAELFARETKRLASDRSATKF